MQTYLRDFTPASTVSTFTTLLKTYHHPQCSLYKTRDRITGFILRFLTLEDGIDRLSRNVGGNYHYLPRNSPEECDSRRRTCLYTDWPVRVLTKSKNLWTSLSLWFILRTTGHLTGLRSLSCWDCGFASRQEHVCVCCVLSGRGLADGPILCPEESYQVWCV
jgi:hypothetical protein